MTGTVRPWFERQAPPEISALRQVKREHPELAVAVDLQIEIATLKRRVQGRLTTPWIDHGTDWFAERIELGDPVLCFDDVAFDWMEFRVLFRQLTDVLQRYETIERTDHARLHALARASHPTTDEVRAWFDAGARRRQQTAAYTSAHGDAFEQVLGLSAQPFIERASEVVRSRSDISAWLRPYCPFCGGEPEMASLAPDGSRRLHCGRCTAAWGFDPHTCPSCDTHDRRHLVSYASPDGPYQILACNNCRRYLKALDGRRVDRPLMLAVDAIATLPLDAAAARQGYSS